ncbi:duplicated homeodomain-like superfamily protein [Actinidia rufa]|uniref:Duplicated homeodomain-like superfamily protein n=1 Tax=Actinidia rufa TaxID=165716 RepID=A0A7J0EMQ8_9ERIC|nr:duplicated homeodomain-like superfamily protein [Actinidia rufa]
MSINRAFNSSFWTREQDKAFENALAIVSEDSSDQWEKVAAMVPGKTVEEIKHHYVILVEDIDAIESGCVPLPCYKDSASHVSDAGFGREGRRFEQMHSDSCSVGKSSRSDQERRRGIAWTEEEHTTPTQVASHAQKYFIRLSSANKERRRSSIHDITSVGEGDASTPQEPITGQIVGAASRGSFGGIGNPMPTSASNISGFVPPTIVQSIDMPQMTYLRPHSSDQM